MESLISIDPGVKYFAWARWDASCELHNCGWCLNPDLLEWPEWFFPGRYKVIVESQVASKTDVATRSNIIGLARMSGACASRSASPAVFYNPGTWKGCIPKSTSHIHILQHLEAWELTKYQDAIEGLGLKKAQAMDVSHAIGIGLYHLKRYFPK